MDNHTPNTVQLLLTRGQFAIVDEDDADLDFPKWQAYFNRTYANGGNYVATRTIKRDGKKRTEYMHRTILARKLGRELVSGEVVDHINGNPLDNRRANLRLSVSGGNQRNTSRRKDCASGFKGVRYHKQTKKWMARITISGKQTNLGYFNNPEEAHAAYCEAAVKYYGEFARFE